MSAIQFYSGLNNGYEDFSNFAHAPLPKPIQRLKAASVSSNRSKSQTI